MNRERYILVMKMVLSTMESNKEKISLRQFIKQTLQFGYRYKLKAKEILYVLDEVKPLKFGVLNILEDGVYEEVIK